MPHHTNKRLCRLADIGEKLLKFPLSKEQQAKAGGEKITFRTATRSYKEKGYRQLLSRAEFNKLNPKTGKKHAAPVASKLLGIIYDDDPEWLYETDKTRSSKAEVRDRALVPKQETNRNIASLITSWLTDDLVCETSGDQAMKIPVPLFLTVVLACSGRELRCASVANCWNGNLAHLQTLFPSYGLEKISPDTVRQVFTQLAEKIHEVVPEGHEVPPKRRR